LDISCVVNEGFLEKYELRLSNAILAEEKHLPMYDELCVMKDVDYIGGGSTLNTIRVCQWMLQKPGATGYMGCIGKDKYGKILTECARRDGVNVNFQINEEMQTGTCAVCIIDKERSLVANLAAANKFQVSHLDKPESKRMLREAKVVYSAGFFITACAEAMLLAAKQCKAEGKPFGINFSAEFVVTFFKDKLAPLVALATHVFTNEDEIKAFAKANDIAYKDMKDLVRQISLIKSERKEGRTVVATQGKHPVLVGLKGQVREYPVELLPKEKIVDLNGAGDAFVGGFLSQLVQGRAEATCVSAGNFAARCIIQTSGTKLVGKPNFVP